MEIKEKDNFRKEKIEELKKVESALDEWASANEERSFVLVVLDRDARHCAVAYHGDGVVAGVALTMEANEGARKIFTRAVEAYKHVGEMMKKRNETKLKGN